MKNWDQQLVQTEEREDQLRKGLRGPFNMLVSSVAASAEKVRVSYMQNRDRVMDMTHPFISTNAWIRALPEPGTVYIGTYNVEDSLAYPLVTVAKQSDKKIANYKSGLNTFRPLYPGEIELNSVGKGSVYLSRRPKSEYRGGSIHSWLDQDKLTSGSRSLIHTRELLQKTFDVMGDEERLGIVVRNKNTWKTFYPKVQNNFAAEHFMQVLNPGTKPKILFTTHKGHVIDENGSHVPQTVTGVPLRVRDQFYANDDTYTETQIDEKGNLYCKMAEAATEGYQLDIPSGYYKKNVNRDEMVTINENKIHTVLLNASHDIGENLSYVVDKSIFIKSTQAQTDFVIDSTSGKNKAYIKTASQLFCMDDTTAKEAIYLMHTSGSRIDIDKDGSIKMASFGGNLIVLDEKENAVNIITKGKSVISIKDKISISDGSGNQLITMDGTDSIQIMASANVLINAKKISFGPNAIFSAVLAEQLAALFDAHIHPTPVGPSGPPAPPTTAAVVNATPATAFISNLVKIRGNV